MKRLFSIGAFLLALLLAIGCSKSPDYFEGSDPMPTPEPDEEQTELAIQLTETDTLLRFSDNETKTIHYVITGDTVNLEVKAEMQNDDNAYTLQITPTSKTAGTVEIQAKTPTDNRVIISASDGRQTVQTSIAVSADSSLSDQTELAVQITEQDTLLRFSDNETKTIHYTITGDTADLVVKAEMQNDDGGYALQIIPTSKTAGTVDIQAKTPTENRVIISASDGRQTVQTSIAVSADSLFGDQTELVVQITEQDTLLQFLDNETKTIHYTITGDTTDLVVKAELQNDDGAYTLQITPTSKTTGTVEIQAKTPTKNRVIVSVSDGRQTIMAAIDVSFLIIHVETPGTLSQLLARYDQSEITALGVTGSINSTDISTLKALPNLSVLDIEDTDLTELTSQAFYKDETLTSVKLPQALTMIRSYAFAHCSGLTGDLTIPNSVTTIGDGAFYGCTGFTGTLTIPSSVTTIGSGANQGYGAFGGCSGFTGNLIIPNSVTEIGLDAFEGCSGFTGNLIIPNSVTEIRSSAFEGCSGFTGNLAIPNSVTIIRSYVFRFCSGLTSITIPNSVTTIGTGAFSGCTGLTGTLAIPNGVTKIGGSAFRECSGLTSITIPNSVTTIETHTFLNCTSLTSITIPNSVTTIESEAFRGCSGLTTLYCQSNTPPQLGSHVFYNVSTSKCVLYVPTGCAEAYRTAKEWKAYTFKDIIETNF